MVPLTRVGVTISTVLSVLAQQPAWPQQNQSLNIVAGANAVCAASSRMAEKVVATVFDSDEKMYKRWAIAGGGNGGKPLFELRLSTSANGRDWIDSDQPTFTSNGNSWNGVVEDTVIFYNTGAADGNKFLLWYVSAPAANKSATGLAMATSCDGRQFRCTAASPSTLAQPGVILEAKEAFSDNKQVVAAIIGGLRCSNGRDGRELMFYKIGLDEKGNVAAAGIDSAISTDGTRWSFGEGQPINLQVVGGGVQTPGLVDELRRLAAAYAAADSL